MSRSASGEKTEGRRTLNRSSRPDRLIGPILALIGSLISVGCGADATAEEGWRDSLPRHPHIVLYLVDTLRADHLGSYGYAQATSPFVDELAQGSALFESAYAQGPWTVPSVASLMTSTYTSVHGMVDIRRKISESVVTLAEMLRDSGYLTVAFVQSPFSGSLTGLDQGYAHLVEAPLGKMSDEQVAQRVDTIRPLLEWLREWQPERPTFLFVHTMEPHWPLRVHDLDPRFFSEDDKRKIRQLNAMFIHFREVSRKKEALSEQKEDPRAYFRELLELKQALRERRGEIVEFYDKAVRMADARVGQVVRRLKAKGIWGNTMFVFIADHGDEMLDHGYWLHDQSLYDELIRVPLVMRIPGVTENGLRITTPVQLIDLGPTFAELLGRERPAGWQGRSLLRLAAGVEGAMGGKRIAFSERINTRKYDADLKTSRGDRESAVVDEKWKLVIHQDVNRQSLYDRASDPVEQHDLAAQRPEVVKMLRTRLAERLTKQRGRRSGSSPAFELGEAALKQLRSLGYVNSPTGELTD